MCSLKSTVNSKWVCCFLCSPQTCWSLILREKKLKKKTHKKLMGFIGKQETVIFLKISFLILEKNFNLQKNCKGTIEFLTIAHPASFIIINIWGYVAFVSQSRNTYWHIIKQNPYFIQISLIFTCVLLLFEAGSCLEYHITFSYHICLSFS